MTGPDVSLIAPYPTIDGSHHAGTSGVASYAANLARAMRTRGASVHVVAPVADDGRHRVEHDGDGIRVDRCFTPDRGGLCDAARTVQACGAPVAHIQFELFLYGGPGAIVGVVETLGRLRRQGIPTVLTMHQAVDPSTVDRDYTALHRVPVPAPVARAGIGTLQRMLHRASSATVVHEEPFRRMLPDATVIPHGIERPRPLDRATARAELDLDDRFVALCFGFLAPYKGLEVALEAGERAGRDVLVVVAGGEHPRLAASGDGYAEVLRTRYGHGARFTGWVPGDDVARWFSAADVAVFPYPKPFSSSGALALALAYDTAVLLSAPLARCIGAPSDSVFSTTDDLAAKLRTLSTDPAAADRLRAWTSCLADGRAWNDVADRHLDLYGEVRT